MLPMDMLDRRCHRLFRYLDSVEAMGFDVSFGNGGPKIANPVREASDLGRVHIPNPAAEYPWALEVIQRVQAQIGGRPCLIRGSTCQMASYVIEGQTSKSFNKIKAMMYRCPEVVHDSWR